MSRKLPQLDDEMYEKLTERELGILKLLAKGLKDREIAQEIHLALKTVKWYNSQIYSKLGVRGRKEAIARAQNLHLIDSLKEITTPHNLPAQITLFTGREQQLTELADLIHNRTTRLVTIRASGGMGKTRLALEAARQQLTNFQDGVFFTDLSPLRTQAQVTIAIADTLKLRYSSDDEVSKQLKNHLRNKHLLLILDNFEHILDAAPVVHELIEVAPDVKVVVTSREKLRLSGEYVYKVDGLSFPDLESSENILGYDAVKLFLQSVERASHGFQVHTEDMRYVAQICYLTEGMPLALLLAAAWVDVLSLQEIAAEIQTSIDFLGAELRDVPRRQWSIRSVFEPTWVRLTYDQRNVYQMLSVFRGGFARQAAEAITETNIHILLSLANKSLLHLDSAGRYQIHELLRQYAETQLRSDDDAFTKVCDLHCDFFAKFVHERQSQIYFGDQRRAASEIENERENIRAMWEWAVQHTRVGAMQQSLHTLVAVYHHRSRFLEAAAALEKAAGSLDTEEELTEQSSFTLAEVFGHLGHFYLRLGNFKKSKSALKRSDTLYTSINRSPTPGVAIIPKSMLGLLASVQGDYETAVHLIGEALEEAVVADDQMNICAISYFLTGVYFAQGEYEVARQYANRAYHLAQTHGNRWFSAYILNELGNIDRALGNYDEAKHSFQKSYLIREEFDDPEGMAVAANHLGNIFLLEGNYTEAQNLYHENVDIYRDIGDRGGLASALDGLGRVKMMLGHLTRAECYFYEALQIAGTKIIHITFSSLIGLSNLGLHKEQPHNGVELLGLVLNHPAAQPEVKVRAEALLDQYKTDVPRDFLVAGIERGKALDLDTIVAELLDKYNADC